MLKFYLRQHLNILLSIFFILSSYAQIAIDEVDIVAYNETTTHVPVGYGYGNLGPYYVHEKIWVFYSDGTDAYWRTKLIGEGQVWSERYYLFQESQGAFFNVAFDGTYFHFIRQINDDTWGDLEYRRGKAEENGNITFENEQVIFSDNNWKVSNRHFSIYVDSNDHVWVMAKVYYEEINRYKPIVLSSVGSNGVWSDRPGFPKDLGEESRYNLNGRGPKIIEVNEGEVLLSWRQHMDFNSGIFARLWSQAPNNPEDEGNMGGLEWTEIPGNLSLSGETSVVSPEPGIGMINSGKTVSRRNANGSWTRVDPPGIIEDPAHRANSLSVYNGTVRIWDVDGNNIRYAETSDNGNTWSNVVVKTTADTPSHLSATHSEGSAGSFHGILWREGDSPYDIGMAIEGEVNEIDPPLSPALVSPPDDAFDVPVNAELTWEPVGIADSYTLQISDNSDMDDILVDQTDIQDTVFTVTLDYNTEYFWRVRAKNIAGEGEWSEIWSFTTIEETPETPVLASPTDGALNISVDTVFTWEETERAESYLIQISVDPDFAVIEFSQTDITDTDIEVTGLSHETDYYWRVAAENSGGQSDWSDVWSFTTVVAAADTPLLVSPGDGAENISTDTVLVWESSERAETYHLQISIEENFDEIELDHNGIEDTEFAVNGLEHGETYYWRVRAENAGGYSDWSEVWGFTTIIALPVTPVLVSPANGSESIAVDTMLVWEETEGADSYHLQVSTAADFSDIVTENNSINGLSYEINGLESMTTYYWRVRAANEAGYGEWSELWSFTTNDVNSIYELAGDIPDKFNLDQNYPNPFNPATTIRFALPKAATVQLEIYNMLGQRVATLINGEHYTAGTYEAVWYARDDTGNEVSSGLYIYRIISAGEFGEYVNVKKMLFMK